MTQIRAYDDVWYINEFFDVVDMLDEMKIKISNDLLSINSGAQLSIEFLHF